MSYTTVYKVEFGVGAESVTEFKNSWGSAPYVWETFGEKYLGGGMFVCDREKLWNAWKDKSIPESHRAVLVMTFDNVYIDGKDFARAAKDIGQYIEDMGHWDGVNHWPMLKHMLENNNYKGLAIWHTSVSSFPLASGFDEEKEQYTFDWKRIKSVYEMIDGVK